MERGIKFTIGYKKADCNRFRPKESDEEVLRSVSKAVVDLRVKGPRLSHSPSMVAVYRDFRQNVGKVGGSLQAVALILPAHAVRITSYFVAQAHGCNVLHSGSWRTATAQPPACSERAPSPSIWASDFQLAPGHRHPTRKRSGLGAHSGIHGRTDVYSNK
ncbi:hypothetical protein B0H13DRAFT_1911468 [Mycena leptocephala]|nr:hypothetical protein B0H13DRAFT_1911468 [Mycena leptocephala]